MAQNPEISLKRPLFCILGGFRYQPCEIWSQRLPRQVEGSAVCKAGPLVAKRDLQLNPIGFRV